MWSLWVGSWFVGPGWRLRGVWLAVLGTAGGPLVAAGLGLLGFGSLRSDVAGLGVVVGAGVWVGSVEWGGAGRAVVGIGRSRTVCELLLASRAGAAFFSLNEWDRVI